MTYHLRIHIMICFHRPHHFTSDLLWGWSPCSSILACSHDGTSLRIRSCYDPEASGEHTLDQPTRGQIAGTPYGAIMRSMSDIYMQSHESDLACQTWPSYARRGPGHTRLNELHTWGVPCSTGIHRQTSPTWLTDVEGRCTVLYPGGYTCPSALWFYKFYVLVK